MINSRLAVAIHILALIASKPREQLSSEQIAASVNTNPVVVRRICGLLKKGGLLQSRAGVIGSSLTKDPFNITLFEIYRSVQTKEELFAIHENPNQNCPVGKKIYSTLDDTFESVQKMMEKELKNKSLEEIIHKLTYI